MVGNPYWMSVRTMGIFKERVYIKLYHSLSYRFFLTIFLVRFDTVALCVERGWWDGGQAGGLPLASASWPLPAGTGPGCPLPPLGPPKGGAGHLGLKEAGGPTGVRRAAVVAGSVQSWGLKCPHFVGRGRQVIIVCGLLPALGLWCFAGVDGAGSGKDMALSAFPFRSLKLTITI
jgi:hypothetical protein